MRERILHRSFRWEVIRPHTPAFPGAEDPMFGVWPILQVVHVPTSGSWTYARNVLNPELVMQYGWPYLEVVTLDLSLILEEELARR